MKNLRFLAMAAIVFVSATASWSQISGGVKAGANFADTRINGLIDGLIPDPQTYTGFTVGAVAEIPMAGPLSFRPELNYTQKGFVISQALDVNVLGIDVPFGAKAKTRVNYIEAPLLLKYNFGTGDASFYVTGGPTISYAANAHLRPVASVLIDINLPRTNIDLSNNIYQRWEVSGTLGAGAQTKAGNGKIFVDGRYNMGFTNMLDNPIVNLSIKNQGFALSAGYLYTFSM